MGSYAYITIAGYPIDSSKNYFAQWYFRKSERRIVKKKAFERNELLWVPPDAEEADEEVEEYVFETKASVLRRRLELAGYTRATLQQDFSEAIAARIAFAEEHSSHFDDYGGHLGALHAPLEAWLTKLKDVVEQKLRVDHWGSMPSTGDPMLDALTRSSAYLRYDDDVPAFAVFFPCAAFENFAVAVLEVVADDAPCTLDITGLVEGGWTDEFDDLIEYSQNFTNFYQVFESALSDIENLRTLVPNNPVLARLLYANAITVMETYLSDTVKKNVLNRPALTARA